MHSFRAREQNVIFKHSKWLPGGHLKCNYKTSTRGTNPAPGVTISIILHQISTRRRHVVHSPNASTFRHMNLISNKYSEYLTNSYLQYITGKVVFCTV